MGDLGKLQALDTHQKATQQIIFTGNLEQVENAMFFILVKVKKYVLDFYKEPLDYLWIHFYLIKYHYRNGTIQQCKCKSI